MNVRRGINCHFRLVTEIRDASANEYYRPTTDTQNGRMNRLLLQSTLVAGWLCYVGSSIAGEPFTGRWSVDLRTPAERQRGTECGTAEFVLTQVGDAVTGTHSMAVAGCGRLNEGGPVKGVVAGSTAVLVVTSGRNGAKAMGTAKLSNGKLRWRLVKEISAASPEGDSPLIRGNGTLTRAP